jgi:hypothetical protein
MRKHWTSALFPAGALLLAGCTYDFDRFAPSSGGSDARASIDVAVPESGGDDAETESDVGSDDTSAPGNPGDASDSASAENDSGDAGITDTAAPDVPSTESGGPGDGGNESSGPTYTIGGMLQGMKRGRSVTLQDNGGDDLIVPTNGMFVFSKALGSGAPYDVTVSAQPPAQTCTVMAGTGVVAASNVTNVVVMCQ